MINFYKLRLLLIKEKQEILKKSNIKVHDIDGAIKLACTMYKSATTNYIRGHINGFRIRKWKNNKQSKIMDLENASFSEKGIRSNILGLVKTSYNGEEINFKGIQSDCKLQKLKDKFAVLN